MDTSLVLNIQLEGDVGLAKQYIPEARVLAASLVNRLHLGGVESGSAQRIFSDDVVAYAIVAMNTATVLIIAGGDVVIEKPDVERIYIPDFVSGVVEGGDISQEALIQFYPTLETRRKYDLPAQWGTPHKLAVRPFLVPDTEGGLTYPSEAVRPPLDSGVAWWVSGGQGNGTVGGTHGNINFGSAFTQKVSKAASEYPNPSQYARLKPTFYSGIMRSLVQCLMGFGHNTKSKYKIVEEADGFDDYYPVYEKRVAEKGRQIRYDYRWMRTHGIAKGADGKLWLVEASMIHGVLAMPLPLIARTDSEKFKRLLEELKDVDAIKIVEEFGGFPSGEAFPALKATIDAAIKAGRLIQLASPSALSAFYSKSFYSTAMGWAFSYQGQQAANTCFDWNATNGQMEGYYYTIDIAIGASRAIEPPPQRNALLKLLALFEFDHPDEADSIAFKIDLLTEQQATSALRSSDGAIQAIRDMTVTPLASGSANMTQGGKGYLFTNPVKGAVSLLKFWEPTLQDAVVSFMMKPQSATWDHKVRDCDTTVAVFYDGGTLHKCNFFFSTKVGESKTESDNEPCMYVGTWTTTSGSGGGQCMGNFYTSKLDTRVDAYPQMSKTVVTGSKAGYVEAFYSDYIQDIRRAEVKRAAGFIISTASEITEGYYLGNALVFAGWEREGYYYATIEGFSSKASSHSVGGAILGDPNWGETYRTIAPGSNASSFNSPHPLCGDSRVERRINTLQYDPYPCSDDADSGQWLSECQVIDESMRIHRTLPSSSSNSLMTFHAQLTIQFFSTRSSDILIVKDKVIEQGFKPLWTLNSPSVEGDLQFIFATQSCFGDTDAYRLDGELNTLMDEIKVQGNPGQGQFFLQNITYIGVI